MLRDVSLQADAGELVVIWGLRRSGRSTLLRVAAGIEPPDAGVVRFDGHDLADRGERLLGKGIGYCQRTLRFADGHSALDYAMVGLLSRWVPPPRHACARTRRWSAPASRTARACRNASFQVPRSCGSALARTLALRPRMVVIDEPVKGVELIERDPILALLRSLADEGLTVLASTGESTGLSQADLGLVLGDGQLRGAPAHELAPVVPLHPGVERQASG